MITKLPGKTVVMVGGGLTAGLAARGRGLRVGRGQARRISRRSAEARAGQRDAVLGDARREAACRSGRLPRDAELGRLA